MQKWLRRYNPTEGGAFVTIQIREVREKFDLEVYMWPISIFGDLSSSQDGNNLFGLIIKRLPISL